VTTASIKKVYQQLNLVKLGKDNCTLPTAASPNKTSFTLLLGFGAFAPADSDMTEAVK
jgi:hypothetical protein